jgi:plastocyanin
MRTRWISIGFGSLALAAVVASGCSKMGASPTPKPADLTGSRGAAKAPVAASPAPSVANLPSLAGKIKPSSGKGAIVGWVVYQGAPPKPKAINFGAEKICADLNRDKSPFYETLVVNPNSTVKNTLVTIRGKVAGDYKPNAQPAVIDQVGCIFTPHVVGVMVGQEVELRNSDPVSHNIRGTPTRNQAFNNVFASKVTSKTKFDSPEIGIPLKCDIHFWMSGYVHVSQHPFFAVTGDDGSFIIPDVPPGEYTLLTWHETLKTQTQPISVKAGEVKEVEFTWPAGH